MNVQAPFTLSPGGITQIRVQAAGGTSGAITLDVLSSAVGLFTSQGNGQGQVLAVNQDGKGNSETNPAAPGSYVALYQVNIQIPSAVVASGRRRIFLLSPNRYASQPGTYIYIP